MNLTFRVLWFDDARDYIESLDLDPLKETIKSWGFFPELIFVESQDEFMKYKPFTSFDLIVVDYNLGIDDKHGEDFIQIIRGNSVYTEIIFYSANKSSDLWDAVRLRELEGVFVANRQVVLEKLERVSHQVVHKVLDLNNMRGMVMAEVGDIDVILDSITRHGFTSLQSEQQKEVLTRFHEDAAKQNKQMESRLGQFGEAPELEGMIELCDSVKRWKNFRRLVKYRQDLNAVQIDNYQDEVLGPRNFLAHGTPQEDGNGYIFRYQKKEYRFDEKTGLDLRQKILSYKEKFSSVESKLKPAESNEGNRPEK